MNVLFLADEALSKEEILIMAKFYPFGKSTNLSIINTSDSSQFNEKLWATTDILVTNRTRVTKQMIEHSPNVVLIGSLYQAKNTIDMIVTEKMGILMIEPPQKSGKAENPSKLQNLQIIFSELELFIMGQPLKHLVKPSYIS